MMKIELINLYFLRRRKKENKNLNIFKHSITSTSKLKQDLSPSLLVISEVENPAYSMPSSIK